MPRYALPPAIAIALTVAFAAPHAAASEEGPVVALIARACPYAATNPGCADRGLLVKHGDEVTVCGSRIRDREATDAKFCVFEGRLQPDGKWHVADGQTASEDKDDEACRIEISQVGDIVKVTPAGPKPEEMASRCRRELCGAGGFLFGEFRVTADPPSRSEQDFMCGA